MRIALYQPDIAQNTGTILRLAACFGVPVDIIGPTGFDMTDRKLRRAGLDYLNHVAITRHVGFGAFRSALGDSRLVLSTTKGVMRYDRFRFLPGDVLLFGRESAGVPDSIHEVADARIRIPIAAPLRSLNLAVACGIVLAEALRQIDAFPDQSNAVTRASSSST